MDIYRNQERELKLAKKPLIVLEDELWQINQLSRLRKDLRNRKKRLEKVIAVKRLSLQAVQEKIAREVENEKKYYRRDAQTNVHTCEPIEEGRTRPTCNCWVYVSRCSADISNRVRYRTHTGFVRSNRKW